MFQPEPAGTRLTAMAPQSHVGISGGAEYLGTPGASIRNGGARSFARPPLPSSWHPRILTPAASLTPSRTLLILANRHMDLTHTTVAECPSSTSILRFRSGDCRPPGHAACVGSGTPSSAAAVSQVCLTRLKLLRQRQTDCQSGLSFSTGSSTGQELALPVAQHVPLQLLPDWLGSFSSSAERAQAMRTVGGLLLNKSIQQREKGRMGERMSVLRHALRCYRCDLLSMWVEAGVERWQQQQIHCR